jgi:hypothetical protein
MHPIRHRFLTPLLATLCVVIITTAPATAADLEPRTIAAFTRYVQATETRMKGDAATSDRFLWPSTLAPGDRQARMAEARRGGVVIERLATTANGRRIDVPDGLVHHWVGLAFLPGVPLDRLLALLQDYDEHAAIYAPRVTRSRLLAHHDDTFRFHLRFVTSKVITVVLDTENEAHFTRPSPDRAVSRIVTTRIAEIDDAGTAREHEKPVGHDNGYLWRLNTYWRLLAADGGTYVECESISLTRGIPVGLGWLIGPFVTSLPRESLEFTLETTRHALTAR